MGTDESRRVVLEFFGHLSAGRGREAMALFDDEGTWWVSGKPGVLPLSGTYGKRELSTIGTLVGAAMPGGIEMTITGTIAEDERVVAEATVYGTSPAGRVYDNRICFVAELRGGRIFALREYFDTIHTNDVLFGNGAAGASIPSGQSG
ncbi:nuclear transport factor 2 family protein [Trujillonella endophytica]|uniref:SnoaL-like domain-containing protein n=1 Tax=Trujillonella endophytica TaxID=673521 RepID=A0A1H8R6L9_9ACTN|nr:nuclear transport factor 2 family protein [Trujillella endophytica]SEO62309.1 hypothetical protein SAMN05660991_01043 [Trujillella endophytica]